MRVVIDLQSAQGTNRNDSIGQNSLALGRALARSAGEHETWLLLNDAFYESVEGIRSAFAESVPRERVRVFPSIGKLTGEDPARSWKLRAAEQVREAFIADLRPDAVVVLNVFEGLVDDAIVSIGRFEHPAPTVTLLHDLLPLESDGVKMGDELFRKWYYRQVMSLRASDRILAVSPGLREKIVRGLQIEPGRVVDLSHGHTPRFGESDTNVACANLRARYGIASSFVLLDTRRFGADTVSAMLHSFAELPGELLEGVMLVIIGADSHVTSAAAEIDVVLLPSLLDDEYRLLCSHAMMCVSVHNQAKPDTFVVEALRAGAAVILVSPDKEVANDAVFSATLRTAPEGLAEALARLLTSAEERSRLSLLSRSYAQSLFWEDAARTTWKVLLELNAEAQRSQVVAFRSPVTRPRLAYFSPLPPTKSGIADYSAVLLPELASYYAIDIIADSPDTTDEAISACFPVRSLEWFERHADEFDRILYHFGNSPFHHYMVDTFERHPGTVVLHDFYLGHLLAYPHGFTEAYRRRMYESHGYRAVVDAANPHDALWRYPINLALLSRAFGVIVHSEHAVEQAELWYGDEVRQNIRKVGFLRAPAITDRQMARSRLGIGDDEFVVCSFGQLGPAKLNDRLLDAWVASRLTKAQRCRLVFVGSNPGPYGEVMANAKGKHESTYDIDITGFATPELYRNYLDAADVAVQLRKNSRGETSAAVFDCLAHEIPLIVNAHGSMRELPDGTAITISDQFVGQELTHAIEALWLDADLRSRLVCNASKYLQECHAPHTVAQGYIGAIEYFARASAPARRARLIESVQSICVDELVGENEAIALARAIDEASPDIAVRTIFVDVSAVVRVDLKTGIQRVTRALLLELLNKPPHGWRVEPVFLGDGPDKQFHYARTYTRHLLGLELEGQQDEPARPLPGDVLLGLDLYWFVSDIEDAYRRWRALGVSIQFVVYDILPVLQRDNFPPELFDQFSTWLSFVARISDGLLCISKAVAQDVATWVERHPTARSSPLRIEAFPLGADFHTSAPSKGMPPDAEAVMATMDARPSVLMVGTVEPRKRHIQALDAMEVLWGRGVEVNLVIVGKQGWLRPEEAARLKNHPETGRRLLWLQGVSDEFLDSVYKAARVLLAASIGEGFGLPLIEAAVHGVPVIARDLPVFREVAGDAAHYFSGDDGEALADAIEQWLRSNGEGNRAPSTKKIPWTTWEQSGRALLKLVLDIRADATGLSV